MRGYAVIISAKRKVLELRCNYKDAGYQMPVASCQLPVTRCQGFAENYKFKIKGLRCDYKDASYQMPDTRASQELNLLKK